MREFGVQASQKWGSAGLNVELEISGHQEMGTKAPSQVVVRMHLRTVLHVLSCEQSARKWDCLLSSKGAWAPKLMSLPW